MLMAAANQPDVSHADLLAAVLKLADEHQQLRKEHQQLRADLQPVIDMKPEVDEVLEVSRAFKVGGKGVKWFGSIATALIALGGLILGIRAIWQSLWQ